MSIQNSIKHLKKDKHFAPLIRKYGIPDLEGRGKQYFRALARMIIYQQLSGKAAGTILKRFVALFPNNGRFPTPEQMRKMSMAKLRSAGLSRQKATYLKDLADKFIDGTINQKTLHALTNDEVTEHLVRVKGIGTWTAHMFLMFTLNRPDVLPTGDLGVRKGFQKVYGLRSMPTHERMEREAKPWREHATTASWYFWQVVDDE
ncbi:MAG TPA: DNA-3-methyladenine glycosylase 2 family protein [Candidatus Paceibacterota bacterium]|nr:DNA-3-methyladenine glycosylase 2 family protein [Candidatus Paceibacterota bacterium]